MSWFVGELKFKLEVVDEATETMKKVEEEVENTKSRFEDLKDVMKTAAGVMLGEIAHDAMGAVISSTQEAQQGFMDYEQTITKILSATSAQGEELERLRRILEETAKSQADLGFTAAESAAALEALVKAGMSAEEAAQALRSALGLAKLEGISTEEAANILVQALTMFGLSANESARALDAISRAADAGIDTAMGYAQGLANCGAMAHTMGLSLEETLSALVILDKTFGSAIESGTYLNALFKDLINKSDELGISLYRADGSMKSLDEIIADVRKVIKGFGNDQKKINEYLAKFDIRAQRAITALVNYDGSIAEVMGEMQEARSVQEKLNMVLGTYAGRLSVAQAQVENASYQLGAMRAELELTWKQFLLGY